MGGIQRGAMPGHRPLRTRTLPPTYPLGHGYHFPDDVMLELATFLLLLHNTRLGPLREAGSFWLTVSEGFGPAQWERQGSVMAHLWQQCMTQQLSAL